MADRFSGLPSLDPMGPGAMQAIAQFNLPVEPFPGGGIIWNPQVIAADIKQAARRQRVL